MVNKRPKPEEIVTMLPQVHVIVGQGRKRIDVIRVKHKLNSTDVMYVLTDLSILRGVPAFIKSDDGPEFIADADRNRIWAVGAMTAYITPGPPWENGFCESFNARFRDELLNGEIVYSIKKAQIIIERCRNYYNTKRPHCALG
jgi:putative transposase